MIPPIAPSVLANARDVWNQTIDDYGQTIELYSADGALVKSVLAFCKRPKILGLFDRTQASFDQERYMVIVKASDFTDVEPRKFMRARWDGEDHAFLSVTKVEIRGVVFGYRILVKG